MMETFAGRLGLEPRAVQATGKEVLNVTVRLVAADGFVLHEFPNIRKLRKVDGKDCPLHDAAVRSESLLGEHSVRGGVRTATSGEQALTLSLSRYLSLSLSRYLSPPPPPPPPPPPSLAISLAQPTGVCEYYRQYFIEEEVAELVVPSAQKAEEEAKAREAEEERKRAEKAKQRDTMVLDFGGGSGFGMDMEDDFGGGGFGGSVFGGGVDENARAVINRGAEEKKAAEDAKKAAAAAVAAAAAAAAEKEALAAKERQEAEAAAAAKAAAAAAAAVAAAAPAPSLSFSGTLDFGDDDF